MVRSISVASFKRPMPLRDQGLLSYAAYLVGERGEPLPLDVAAEFMARGYIVEEIETELERIAA